MFEIEPDDEVQKGLIPRFGKMRLRPGQECPLPATAPTPRLTMESRVVRLLSEKGAQVPVVIVPLSSRKDVMPELGAMIPNPRVNPLVDTSRVQKPLPFPDVEAEALIFSCRARQTFREERPEGRGIKELLACGLTGNAQKGIDECSKAWEQVEKDYRLDGVRKWYEKMEEQICSPVFLGPTPIIRKNRESVKEAFRIGWWMADTVESLVFKGRGIPLLIHAEVLEQGQDAADAREEISKGLRAMANPPSPRIAPFVSMKFHYGLKYLITGTGARVARQNLANLVMDAAELVHAVGGHLILLDWGTWAIGGLDCGADIVGFDCDGSKFNIAPPFWIETTLSRRKRKKLLRMPGGARLFKKQKPVAPWDPEALCDGRLEDFEQMWERNHAIPTGPHVEPLDISRQTPMKQREYRAMQIVDSLLAVGQHFREAARGTIPFREAVLSGIGKMHEQDAMLDIAPSAPNKP